MRICRLKRVFVSHASSEEHAISHLREALPARCILDVFFDPLWNPAKAVSAEIVQRIQQADAVVVIDTEHSKTRQWVFFETQYALLARKPLYRFALASGALKRDRQRPLDLKVFPSYSRRDYRRVEPLLDRFAQRFFDTWDDRSLSPGTKFVEAIENALTSRLAAGGYCVLFLSKESVSSIWVRQEMAYALRAYPTQILPVLMDDAVDVFVEVAQLLAFKWIPGEEKSLEWLADELVLQLYALIGKKHGIG